MANRKKELEYAGLGLGLGVLGYLYLKSKSKPKQTISVPTKSTASTNNTSTQTKTPINNSPTQTPSSNTQCNLITPDNFSPQLLAACFGGSVTKCGLYEPLTTDNGFCEAYSSGMNSSITKPDIKSGLVFHNKSNGFFGLYWVEPGVYGGVSPCYCQGNKQVFPALQTGNFFNWIGLILPGYYTWLPVYEFPSEGIGFLVYKGVMWYSPLTYAILGYIKNNNIVYTITLEDTPDSLGYSIQTYTTSTSGGLCFNYPDFNSNFCVPIAYDQTIPFWVNDNTTVKFCPSSTPIQCTTIFG